MNCNKRVCCMCETQQTRLLHVDCKKRVYCIISARNAFLVFRTCHKRVYCVSHMQQTRLLHFAKGNRKQGRGMCHSQGLGLLYTVHHSPTLQRSRQRTKTLNHLQLDNALCSNTAFCALCWVGRVQNVFWTQCCKPRC